MSTILILELEYFIYYVAYIRHVVVAILETDVLLVEISLLVPGLVHIDSDIVLNDGIRPKFRKHRWIARCPHLCCYKALSPFSSILCSKQLLLIHLYALSILLPFPLLKV